MATSEEGHLGRAAARLGLARSSLSACITGIEDELGCKLFTRVQRGLAPTAQGGWLFRESLNILHMERLLRRALPPGGPKPQATVIAVDLQFTIGRLTAAVMHAMEDVAERLPGTCFTVKWRDSVRTGGDPAIHLRYQLGRDDAAASVAVAEDQLMLLRHRGRPGEPLQALTVPRLHGVPTRWLKQRLQAALGPAVSLIFERDGFAAIEATLDQWRDRTLLVPASALSGRLDAAGWTVEPMQPPLLLPIVMALPAPGPAATLFARRLGIAMSGPAIPPCGPPVITARQAGLFDLLTRAQSITGAARLAGIAQPAATAQLAGLEGALGHRLFDRGRCGLTITEAGRRFAEAAPLLNAACNGLAVRRPAATGDGGRLRLGILPAVGAGGFLIRRVASAVQCWRDRYKTRTVSIMELPNALLQERIRSGSIDLGIISTRSLRMARFDLGSSEALALVASPGAKLHPAGGPIEFAALASLPLVLPSARFGLRQLIDAAGHKGGVVLHPVIEADSLTMCLALVREGRVGTILPASDVADLVMTGELQADLIHKPRIIRTLQIIYSTARRLTEPERDLIRMLRAELAVQEDAR